MVRISWFFSLNLSGARACDLGERWICKRKGFVMGNRRSKREVAAMESAMGVMSQVLLSLRQGIESFGGEDGCIYRLSTPDGRETVRSLARVMVRDSIKGATELPLSDEEMVAVERYIQETLPVSDLAKQVLFTILSNTEHGARGVLAKFPKDQNGTRVRDEVREVFSGCSDEHANALKSLGLHLEFHVASVRNSHQVWMSSGHNSERLDIIPMDLEVVLPSEDIASQDDVSSPVGDDVMAGVEVAIQSVSDVLAQDVIRLLSQMFQQTRNGTRSVVITFDAHDYEFSQRFLREVGEMDGNEELPLSSDLSDVGFPCSITRGTHSDRLWIIPEGCWEEEIFNFDFAEFMASEAAR